MLLAVVESLYNTKGIWAFGLGSLASAGLGIGSCFFDSAETVPELLKPFYESSGMLGMILFVVLGVVWWILYAAYTNMGEPENSGMAYPENPKNKKKDNTIIDEKYGFTASDENLDKAIKIKEYCERNNKIFRR